MYDVAKTLHGTDLILNQSIAVSDMRRIWTKLDEVELAAIKNRTDLVMQVQANYGLDKNQAQTRVDLWADSQAFRVVPVREGS